MDRAIVIAVLLLVGLTWLLYRLAVLLEPRAGNPSGSHKGDTNVPAPVPGNGNSRQKLIHQRLRK
jgi:hypothetical protein